jgi:hypothetical protein
MTGRLRKNLVPENGWAAKARRIRHPAEKTKKTPGAGKKANSSQGSGGFHLAREKPMKHSPGDFFYILS